MAKDVRITADSQLQIKGRPDSEYAVNLDLHRIRKVEEIAPVAAHIKEVNHIDPLSVEALNVSEIRNIEPINIERFNVTDLPAVNLSVRQIPAVDMRVRELPAVSIGTHQTFQVPSNYTLRARFLGIEFLRVHLNGESAIQPRERYRREQSRTSNRSQPATATAGNPAIPSTCHEQSAATYHAAQPCPPAWGHGPARLRVGAAPQAMGSSPSHEAVSASYGEGSLSFSPSGTGIRLSDTQPGTVSGGSSVSSGG